jgi:hypothetical protein
MNKRQATAAFAALIQDERVDGKRISHTDRNYRFLLGLPLSRGLGVMGHGDSWLSALESARAHVGVLEAEAAQNDALEAQQEGPLHDPAVTESSPQVAPAETNEGTK